jgi:hypothetical protein
MLMENLLNKLFKKKVIVNCERDPYLHRWYLLKTPWVGIFIHKFVRGDDERALHDHPWPFLVIPLWRGYWEHSEKSPTDAGCVVANLRRVYPIIGTRIRPATFRHRVELLPDQWECVECLGTGQWHNDLGPFDCPGCGGGGVQYGDPLPSWSLFIRFKWCREWGLWPKSGWVSWKQWWNDLCED